MDLAGYVINAVLVEGRSVKEVCETHDISRSWLYELIARYRELGDDGLKPHSKRPHSSPTRGPGSYRGPDRRPPQGADQPRRRRRRPHHPLPPPTAAPTPTAG